MKSIVPPLIRPSLPPPPPPEEPPEEAEDELAALVVVDFAVELVVVPAPKRLVAPRKAEALPLAEVPPELMLDELALEEDEAEELLADDDPPPP